MVKFGSLAKKVLLSHFKLL